jgi:hypothetical protein
VRAILIDAKARTITESEIPDGATLDAMQSAVGGSIETAFEFPNHDTVFVNEEGLLGPMPDWFEVKGGHQPFVGNGIVCGFDPDSGDTIAAKSTIEEIRAAVTFKSLSQVRAAVMSKNSESPWLREDMDRPDETQ